MICNSCNATNNDNNVYCEYCGTPLKNYQPINNSSVINTRTAPTQTNTIYQQQTNFNTNTQNLNNNMSNNPNKRSSRKNLAIASIVITSISMFFITFIAFPIYLAFLVAALGLNFSNAVKLEEPKLYKAGLILNIILMVLTILTLVINLLNIILLF